MMSRKVLNDLNFNDNKENQQNEELFEMPEQLQHRYMQSTKSANFKRIQRRPETPVLPKDDNIGGVAYQIKNKKAS